MDSLTLRFIHETGFTSRMIEWFSFSDWCHVDLKLFDGDFIGARLDGGVQIRSSNYVEPALSMYVDIPVTKRQKRWVVDAAYSQVGKPYDVGGIVGFLFRSDAWNSQKKWFCSEFCTWVFKQGRIDLLNTSKVWRITPGMLAMSPVFTNRRIVEGK